jgi:hypothetical protein
MRLVDSLKWPVVALIVTGMVHLGAEAVRPDLKNAFTPNTIGPILLAYGIWVGVRSIDGGASIVAAAAAGFVVGLLPLMLDLVGFGILLGRGVDAGLTAGAFGLLMVAFGALIGAGFAASGRRTTSTTTA